MIIETIIRKLIRKQHSLGLLNWKAPTGGTFPDQAFVR